MDIKLNQLEVFVAVADTGSFSAAALELECTQSRISHAVAELEQAVGMRLLERSRTGSVLTEAGERVLQKARQILHIAEGIPAAAAGDTRYTGELRIACFRSVGALVLPAVLEALARDHPGIRVDVDDSGDGHSANIVRAVEQGRADIGIARMSEERDLVQLPYLYDTYRAIVPASVRVGTPVRWSQFDGLDYIQPKNADGVATLERCRAAGYRGKAARRMTNDLAILNMIERGLGFAVLPAMASYPVPSGARAAGLPFDLRRDLAVYVRDDVARLKVTRVVLRYLRSKKIISATGVYRAGGIGFNY